MKPQLYSIVILLLTRINYAQNNSAPDAAVSSTQLPLISTNNPTSVAKPSGVTSVTKAPDDDETSASETTEDKVTSVTEAPKGNPTSVANTARETMVSKIPTDKVTVHSEAPNSQATSAPSLAPDVPPVRTTKGFTMTTRNGGTPKATGSASISTGNQTSKPIVAGNATTQPSNKVTDAVRKTTKLTSTKSTTGNRTSAFPVPSLFAIVLLVVSVLCF